MQKVLRLDLVSHGMTEAMRKARFPVDEPLTEAGRRAASACGRLNTARVLTAPERRTVETAALMGLLGAEDDRLRDLDAGAWRGGELMTVPKEDLYAWLTDPTFKGHGGESVVDVIERTAQWLADIAADGEPTIAITHPAVIRCALLVALDAPAKSFWRIDIPPVSITRLHYRGEWTLHFRA
ncbi:histidine phosphatase family protein [Nocardia otitidiscaviarum]|uniref:histidine phosphatase family protein n=1 Tax=Nocardia otitidiscaviarum TaxID=1823 RepID=UPI0004A71328|nr:histidine phosphatase family protein [Nocardia otitidiscaviarum]MCP9620784.1 histidine phosphatase family protein [Nocardia otitidiscaviarum]